MMDVLRRLFCPLNCLDVFKLFLVISLGVIGSNNAQDSQRIRSQCYDLNNQPQRCMPEFVNAAFNLPVHATNTCGVPRIRYCRQTGVTGAKQSCSYCDTNDPALTHPSRFLTDFNNNENQTWWQSETMFQGIQHPNTVNLTLKLGKSFDITYVRIKFYSPRPESFAIYKITSEDGDWVPYQYYSQSCMDTYNQPTDGLITREDEQKSTCTADFSDISPLTGGNVAFSTLEGRPSAYSFERSSVLQDWVTATSIRVVLTRLNTFGDEVFADKTVLQSYYYGISDISIGGRCKCNGHASECIDSAGQGGSRLVCRCEHNTQGPDCNECMPFYNDRPWARATADTGNACLPCDCKGLSRRCFFDKDLYEKTGHGGHCKNCQENTDGPHCEQCKPNFYRRQRDKKCVACNCDPIGSANLQCDNNGRCDCKRGVTGDKCDQCQSNHYDFGPNGCRPCACEVAGSLNNDPRCLPDSGICACKDNAEGQNCDTCKPGFFGLSKDDPYGCQSCFCFGHSSVCTSAPGYKSSLIESDFDSNSQRFSAVDFDGKTAPIQYDHNNRNIIVSAPGIQPIYFSLPRRFLGDKRFSYNQYFSFKLQITGHEEARATRTDVILESGDVKVSTHIFSQSNNLPRDFSQEFKFRLHEHTFYKWSPRMTALDFISILGNLTAIKIRGTYAPSGSGILDDVKLVTAARSNNGGEKASWVEQCTCPKGYVGQFCESCAPGYHRDPSNGGPFARCVPCNCNNHSQSCDVNSGRCICQHNTAGENCERCAPGFYGYAMKGTAEDCTKCPCPDDGSCVELLTGDIACINCKPGYAGLHCDLCADGFFGDPAGRLGSKQPCQKCVCNDNIDPNAVANCNICCKACGPHRRPKFPESEVYFTPRAIWLNFSLRVACTDPEDCVVAKNNKTDQNFCGTSGECLKCTYDTYGDRCQDCLPGYYGDPIALPKGQCKACDCFPPGSKSSSDGVIQCDRKTGQCPCKVNVVNRKCDTPAEGFYDINKGGGGKPCNCHPVGSYNASCDTITGQCPCKPGVAGLYCDKCLPTYYGFDEDGCEACNCDSEGSVDLQCDENGQCPCKPSVVGATCNVCEENKFNITAGCDPCPACYSLIKSRIDRHRTKMLELRDVIDNVGSNPVALNDTDFKARIDELSADVSQLLGDARKAIGIDAPLATQLEDIQKSIKEIEDRKKTVDKQIAQSDGNILVTKDTLKDAIGAADRAEKRLIEAEMFIDGDGKTALKKATEAQETFGQQSSRMTEISKEAREKSQQQKESAETIDKMAKDALDTSNKAWTLAREAMQSPVKNAETIANLRKNVTDAEMLFNSTSQAAQDAQNKVTEMHKATVDTFTKAKSLTLPLADVDNLMQESKDFVNEAKQIQSEADRLMTQNEALIDDVGKQMSDAKVLLDSGRRQQNIADELLSDVDVARATARSALALGESTLRDANETLKTLKEFDEKVKASKTKAEEALKEIPAIEKQITLAEKKTAEAQEALKGAKTDADIARNVAEEAKTLAEKASKDADQIQKDGSIAKDRAKKQTAKAESLAKDVKDADKSLGETEIQAEDDEKIIRQALEKADEAKNSASESSKKVKDALETVKKILNDLEELDMVDTDRLDALEKKLAGAEEELDNSKFNQRYDQLVAGQSEQQEWLNDFFDDINQLKEDVNNVQAISESLPDGCFKTTNIEVP